MNKKVALITGSTDGIGRAIANALAEQGWTIIIHGRDLVRCQNVANELKSLTRVDYYVADLSSKEQILNMCNRIRSEYSLLDLIVNNAGTYASQRTLNQEGIEKTLMVNYLARFLIIRNLLPLLKKSKWVKVIDISGTYHRQGEIYFEDINLENAYSPAKANNQSKLANVIFTIELAKRLKKNGIKNVRVNSLHPGAVKTAMITKESNPSTFMRITYNVVSMFFKSPAQSAKEIMQVVNSEESSTGKYYEFGHEIRPSYKALESGIGERLWKKSEELLDISFDI